MNTREPLNLEFNANRQQPVRGLIALILEQAIRDRADSVIFELDIELHQNAEAVMNQMMMEGIMPNSEQLPKAFQTTIIIGEKRERLPPASGMLFEPAMRILLTAAEIPDVIFSELETTNPSSKWRLKVEKLNECVALQRI